MDYRQAGEARIPAESRGTGSDELAPAVVGQTQSTTGHLVIRAMDADSRLPLDRIRVRAMNATRFADRFSDRDGEGAELNLTPGTYSILVLAKAYEPVELPLLSIESGQVTTPDSVPMHAGSARILGAVTGDTWRSNTLWVDLSGEGRRPCPACAETPNSSGRRITTADRRSSSDGFCGQCGYSINSSRLAVPPDGRFAFDRLASGPYAIRLVDAGSRTLCDPKFIELAADQSLRLEIPYGAPRSVRVEVIDTDGGSLAPEWAARLRRDAAAEAEGSEVTFIEVVSNPQVEVECAFRTAERQIGLSTFIPPPPDPNSFGIGVAAFGSRKLGAGAKHGRGGWASAPPDDRAREEKDILRPELPPIVIGPSYFPSELEQDGFVRFDSVPSLEMTLTMTTGPFTATTAIPSSRDVVRLQATLHLAEKGKDSKAEAESSEARTFREYEVQRAR